MRAERILVKNAPMAKSRSSEDTRSVARDQEDRTPPANFQPTHVPQRTLNKRMSAVGLVQRQSCPASRLEQERGKEIR
jgi:hypothetical protein